MGHGVPELEANNYIERKGGSSKEDGLRAYLVQNKRGGEYSSPSPPLSLTPSLVSRARRICARTYNARAEKRGGGEIRLVYLDRFLCVKGMSSHT